MRSPVRAFHNMFWARALYLERDLYFGEDRQTLQLVGGSPFSGTFVFDPLAPENARWKDTSLSFPEGEGYWQAAVVFQEYFTDGSLCCDGIWIHGGQSVDAIRTPGKTRYSLGLISDRLWSYTAEVDKAGAVSAVPGTLSWLVLAMLG
ncbi:unnamed protein product [Symbiodinium sp. CCMP2592]|nr:unnamed protein product [Symbiodinium sp. CCMP2592]